MTKIKIFWQESKTPYFLLIQVQAMRAGVVGRIGAHATVRRGEKQFQRSLGQDRVFRRSLEERTVLFWKTRPG